MNKMFKLFFSKNGQRIWLVLLIIFPIILWILPGNYFEENSFVSCPSVMFFDVECYGCGMTRAIMHMHHFQFEDALFFNMGSFIIYPFLAVVWIIWVRKAMKRLNLWPKRD